jgi:hypothetical protein
VTADTVTGIDVNLRHPPLIETTGIDLTRFKKIEGSSDMIGHYYYLNDDSSFAIEVGNNYVSAIIMAREINRRIYGAKLAMSADNRRTHTRSEEIASSDDHPLL